MRLYDRNVTNYFSKKAKSERIFIVGCFLLKLESLHTFLAETLSPVSCHLP